MGRYHVLGAASLALAGTLAAFGVFWDPLALPAPVDWGSKLIAVIGVIFTVLALLGRPVPGLWQMIELLGEKWYLKYCEGKGVPEVEARERMRVGKSQLILSESDIN